ncbi:BTB/POZ domain-containing protein [Dichanthelium oligosanthes]|uniref:BTB/POZ domain-containing protein n=1 Tax=Dichanthelium oligosanthes TaxID=888268 RepID=A0A1E5WLA1_9POAL|nr:BTB/POZ domain-containing protein [Dichanthelium oligosanthes]
MGVATVTELKQSISGKRTFRPSLISRQANEWPPTDVSSDLTVEVGTSSFALHKLFAQFPLVSRSGKIRRLVAEAKDAKLARLSLHGTPGGAPAFELAAKFCYGVHVDVTVANVAMLRCAAHYLQMTEDFSDKNLELRAEAYLRDAVLPSIASSVTVLRSCEALLPAAEDVNLVARLIAAIANNVCKEQLTSGLSKLDQCAQLKPAAAFVELDSPGDWWGKSVAGLGLDFFQRLLSAVKAKGLKQETVTRILINYAQNSLHGLMARDVHGASKCGGGADADAIKKQRAVVEAIVGLLPAQSKKSPVHPNIKEAERYRLCKAIDCQRLTPDACSHAAQNDRLPIQMVVRVLYFEQLRLRSAIQAGGGGSMGGGHDAALFFGCAAAAASSAQGSVNCMRSGSGVGSGAMSPRDNYASVRRENRELKLEVARMRMRLTDLEKDHVSMKRELVRVGPANRLLRGFARSLSRLNALFRMRPAAEPGLQQLGAKATADAKVLFQRRRRHSIS